jgi:hypothetical protein
MIWLWLALMVFFAWRAFVYFNGGRAFAGIAAGAACLLFVGAIYVEFARSPRAPAGPSSAATSETVVKRENPADVERNMAREREAFAARNRLGGDAMHEGGDAWSDESSGE